MRLPARALCFTTLPVCVRAMSHPAGFSSGAGVEGVSVYVLRHTAGVWMAKAGVPLEEIAAFMGHSNIEITRKHYARFHPSFMSKSAAALEFRNRRRYACP